jgi:hypothetical protein
MRVGLAFLAGVIGGAVMIVAVAIARAAGITDLNFGILWGSMITGTATAGTWVLGALIHLVVSGLIAFIYAAVFEAIKGSNWFTGLIGGAIHAVIGGLLFTALPAIHPAIPNLIRDPGAFAINYGSATAALFVVGHLIYGIIVGSMYTPVHTHKLPAATKREIEEPVGVGHEEHMHTNEPRRR